MGACAVSVGKRSEFCDLCELDCDGLFSAAALQRGSVYILLETC